MQTLPLLPRRVIRARNIAEFVEKLDFSPRCFYNKAMDKYYDDEVLDFRVEVALRETAKHYGVTERELLRSIQDTLEEGMNSDDPAVQAAWREIPHKGEKPTVREVIDYLVNKMKSEELH